jgi:hypothetical protein
MQRKRDGHRSASRKRMSLKNLHLQDALRLTDADIAFMRDLEATWSTETEEFIPSTLPLDELIRSVLGTLWRKLTNAIRGC